MSTFIVPLSDALFTRTQAQVLGLLFAQPERSFYLLEIVRAAGVGRGSVQRELERLVNAGLVTVKRVGNQRHYQANAQSPIFHELHGIILKTSGVADVLRAALEPLANDIDAAFVFGSLAAGTAKSGSDVDLLALGDVRFAAVVQVLMDTHERLGREVNPVVMTTADFRRKLAAGERFTTHLWKEPKLFVTGSQHELEELVENRAAART